MREAETVLGVIRTYGTQGLPLKDAYRLLYNRNLYLRAYARLNTNQGAMTPGPDADTVDGMTLGKIDALINELRGERYRWPPVRRTYIPKKNGQLRPLGIPSWTAKLLQEVIRSILEAYYEPQFSDHSHGFRPQRGCHSALSSIRDTWTGTKWFIEGDITACFDSLDHDVLLALLAEKILDNRFLRLIRNLLQAGYLEDWKYNHTLSGAPQGGVVSPILSNIYLDKLDKYVEQVLLPVYNYGATRRKNPAYNAIANQAAWRRKRGRKAEAKALMQTARHLPSRDPQDPGYRRLRYLRYADDFLLGFIGPQAEAEKIKQHLGEFLSTTLKLKLSQEKTLITHAVTEKARFLGYEVGVLQDNEKRDRHRRCRINGVIGLRLPAEVVRKKCAFYQKHGKPTHRAYLIQNDDYTIIAQYQAEYRGLVQYYLLAQNVSWLWQLHWVMRGSLLKTLAAKHKTSLLAMKRKYQSSTDTPYGKLKCLRVTVERSQGKKPLEAQFGGIPLHRQKQATLYDRQPVYFRTDRNELVKRLLADECEVCGSTGNCEVHHIRKLANLKTPGRKEKPPWAQLMARRRRKTLVVCASCHDAIHAGKLTRQPNPK